MDLVLASSLRLDQSPMERHLDVENKDQFPDLSDKFRTNQVFENRDCLLAWAKRTGEECGFFIITTKSDGDSCRRRPRLHLSCARFYKYVGDVRLRNCCPFELRAVCMRGRKKCTLQVHCGYHNHGLENELQLTKPRRKITQPDSPEIGSETPRIESTVVNESRSLSRRRNTRQSMETIGPESFWGVTRCMIDNVQNVSADGHCGFRAVAAGLKMDSVKGWLDVRKELIEEITAFRQDYTRIYGDENDINKICTGLEFTSRPCPPEYWFKLPVMGHLVSSRYGIVLVCISRENAQTYAPLRSPPPTDGLKIVAIGNVDGNHFVSLELKSDCPLPNLVKLWADREVGEKWSDHLKNRLNAFNELLACKKSSKKKTKLPASSE